MPLDEQVDTSAAGSAPVAPETSAPSQPSDTGDAQQSQASTDTRGPIPYERWEQYQRQTAAKYNALKEQHDRAVARQAQKPDPSQTFYAKMLERMQREEEAKEEEQFADPLERDFNQHRKSWEAERKRYDGQLSAVQERLNQFETQRIEQQLRSEYEETLKSGTFPASTRFFQTDLGMQQLGEWLTRNRQSSVRDAFTAFEGALAQLNAQQGASAAAQGAPAAKPKPTLHTPGTGGSVPTTPPKPRTLEEASQYAKSVLSKGRG